ncbi:hypothetical protein MRX96_024899 [Rhipicephalus microplus]
MWQHKSGMIGIVSVCLSKPTAACWKAASAALEAGVFGLVRFAVASESPHRIPRARLHATGFSDDAVTPQASTRARCVCCWSSATTRSSGSAPTRGMNTELAPLGIVPVYRRRSSGDFASPLRAFIHDRLLAA